MLMRLGFCCLFVSLIGCNRDKAIGGDSSGVDDTNSSGNNNNNSNNNNNNNSDDVDAVGDDIASAASVAAWEDIQEWGQDYLNTDLIDEPGDRDFFAIPTTEGYDYLIATAAYVLSEEMKPDTVLRLYDQEGTLLVTNDDMPFRFWETDSAIWFQAEYSGMYYVEVLEFSDWAESEDGAKGGEDYVYELWGWQTFYSEMVSEGENNTQEEADALAELASENDDVWLYYTSWFDDFIDDSYAQYITNIYGHISYEGDVDVWRFDLDYSDDEDGWGWMTWTSFDMAESDFAPRMSLYNADWEVLASTTDLGYSARYYATYDTDIAYPVTTGTYYLVMEDDNGYGGLGSFYAINRLTWLGSLAMQENEENNSPFGANILEMTESSSTDGYFYGKAVGNIGEGDDADVYQVLASDVGGSLGEKYLNVAFQAQGVGSFLDAKLVVYNSDGAEVLTEVLEVDEVEGGDPYVLNLQLPAELDSVYIAVEPESVGESEMSNFYILGAYISEEPD